VIGIDVIDVIDDIEIDVIDVIDDCD